MAAGEIARNSATVSGAEIALPIKYFQESVSELRREIRTIARVLEGAGRRVDQYRVQTLTADSELTLTLLPQFERLTERITSIVVTGPPSTAFSLQLGKRNWALVTPATGILVIAPLAMLLDYDSSRILTSATPGDWSLELMGDADVRNRT